MGLLLTIGKMMNGDSSKKGRVLHRAIMANDRAIHNSLAELNVGRPCIRTRDFREFGGVSRERFQKSGSCR
jgi:hypothetical protein